MTEFFKVFCDGGVRGQNTKDKSDRIGSFGSVILDEDNREKYKFGLGFSDDGLTNNRLEMLALIFSVSAVLKLNLGKEVKVEVNTDSQILHKGINEWMTGWKKKGWKKANGKVVENKDLWLIVDKLFKIKNLHLETNWVKGHVKITEDSSLETIYNNRVDEIVNEVMDNGEINEDFNDTIKNIDEFLDNLMSGDTEDE